VVLKILKELLQYQSEMFMPYAELTILRLLEFEKDTDKEVSVVQDVCHSAQELETWLSCCHEEKNKLAFTS